MQAWMLLPGTRPESPFVHRHITATSNGASRDPRRKVRRSRCGCYLAFVEAFLRAVFAVDFARADAFFAVPFPALLAFQAAGRFPRPPAKRAAPSRDAFATCLPTSGARFATSRPTSAAFFATPGARSATPFSAPGA